MAGEVSCISRPATIYSCFYHQWNTWRIWQVFREFFIQYQLELVSLLVKT